MSLKDELFNAIKKAHPKLINIGDVEAIAHMLDRKVDNATRRLRELCDGDRPLVKPIRNEKKWIVGYQYMPENELKTEENPKVEAQGELFKFHSAREFVQ